MFLLNVCNILNIIYCLTSQLHFGFIVFNGEILHF